MKKISKRMVSVLLTAVIALGSLTACGKGTNTSKTDASVNGSESAQASESNANANLTANKDIELTVGYPAGIESATPFRNMIAQDAPYFRQIYESMAILDQEKGEYVPWVAKEWKTEDGKVFHVTLRENVKDQKGNQIKAEDIVWFLEESKKAALKPPFAKVEKVEKTGDLTLDVTMTENVVGAFETVMVNTFVISKKEYESNPDAFATKPVTTSAYQLTAFTPSLEMTFERTAEHWQDPAEMPAQVVPNVKKVTYKIITEASQQGVALETGVIDMFINMDTTTGASYVQNPDYVTHLSNGPQGWTLFFSGHESRPVANDPKLAQAIAYSIDTDGLISALAGGYATKMNDVCPEHYIGSLEKWKNEEYFKYDVEKAKALLAESNYKGETLVILVSSSTFTQRLAQMIQGFMINIGIKCELLTGDQAYISSVRLDGSLYDMFINTIGGTYLADHWAIRYDMNAYKTGDGTARKDKNLADILYKTWTKDGYTEENIDAVHKYIMDNGIARGLINPQTFVVHKAELKVVKPVIGQSGFLSVVGTEYTR